MSEPVVVSVAIQMGPLVRPDGEPFAGDLQVFADSLTAYIATNLERFADVRGGDTYVALVAKRGDETGGGEYRSGHYVQDAPAGEPT